MRKFIIIAASIAALAIPTAALASVAVDSNGNGFVGKGDVQTALGYGNGNDTAFQKDALKATFSITSDVTTTWIHGIKCGALDSNGGFIQESIHPIDPVNMGHSAGTTTTITSTPKITGGKVTGYNLTGVTTATPDTLNWSLWYQSCPAGERYAGWVDASNVFRSVTTPGHGLQVTIPGVGTADLPNTPVVLPAA